MRHAFMPVLVVCCAAGAVRAQTVMVLGDSLGFGLNASEPASGEPSYGDQGWAAGWANRLAARNGGVRPSLVNLSVPFETAPSFFNGTEPFLYALNLNYDPANPGTQAEAFTSRSNAITSGGGSISHVAIAQGGTDSLWLMADPFYLYGTNEERQQMIDTLVSSFSDRYNAILDLAMQQAPGAEIVALNVYNPARFYLYDEDENNDLLFERGEAIIERINAEIAAAAAARDIRLVDLYSAFLGREDELTNMPGFDDIHPNAAGHALIADLVIPAPGSAALLAAGLLAARRRR